MTGSRCRFGLVVNPDAPFPELEERWRRAEELGFDSLWTADHTADYRNESGVWFDGWVTLAAMATTTSRIRIGALVANPILRHPVILAKQAMAVDHLSCGRLDVGIGTGIAPFDHHALGTEPWSPAERGVRFAEYVAVVDGLLSGTLAGRPFEGRWYRTMGTPMAVGARQRPRPPLLVGGQSPTVRRVAAERADIWNTHGPFGHSADEILEITRRQNADLDDRCRAAGRDPAALRRSLLFFGPLDAWAADGVVETWVPRFREAGMTEFVVFWPEDDSRAKRFETFAAELLPHLRSTV